jgi:hypothetical protein
MTGNLTSLCKRLMGRHSAPHPEVSDDEVTDPVEF